jgi:uncharacterized protein YgbK (DUF1537 family)
VIRLGCIADDFTGGTDVAAALRRAGLTVGLLFGVPDEDSEPKNVDAVVIALKTRTIPADDAVQQSVAALDWLLAGGAERIYFKYCSTFDSTDEGNIGPVTDALLEALDETTTIICPASPEHGRTMFHGHLFVGDRLLSESPMRHHPLTPMTDPDIARVLQRQTEGSVGRLSLLAVRDGEEAASRVLGQRRAHGIRHVVADAVSGDDLLSIARAVSDWPLLTGGAGLAGAVGAVLADRASSGAASSPLPQGPAVVLAGSCSAATLAQVAKAASDMPSYRLDPARTPDPEEMLASASSWLADNLGRGPVIVYSSAGPEDRARGLAAMGPATPDILERTLAALAVAAAELGARRVVVAGGETSGAVVQALGVRSVVIDHEADRGVPWCLTDDGLALLLKSGNFGAEDLLVRAAGGAT